MEKDDFSGPSLEDSGLAHAGSSHGFQKFLKCGVVVHQESCYAWIFVVSCCLL